MSRLVIPKSFPEQLALFRDFKAKVDADGSSSVLIPFFTEQNINLANDLLAANAAEATQKLATKESKDAEKLMEQVNSDMATMMKDMRATFQFLKKFYVKFPRNVDLWGVKFTNSGKIKIPTSFIEQLQLFERLWVKYSSYPSGTSPLEAFLVENGISLVNYHTALPVFEQKYKDAKQGSMLAERDFAQSRLSFAPVLDHLRISGQFLMKLYFKNPKTLGDYGFTVETSRGPIRHSKSNILLGNTKVYSGMVLGSVVTNIGPVAVEILKGVSKRYSPYLLMPTQSYEVPKGFSTLTIRNTSNEQTAKISYTSNRG